MKRLRTAIPFLKRDHALRWVFGASCLIALGWALVTQHAWEDYYITYRASKNLATGHGLTFTAGERVHSFTSPLGVLLPAAASLLTGNRSDDAALWIFRIMGILALGGAAVLLWQTARPHLSRAACLLLLALFAIDTKSVDFSTNGMETGFMLLFLAWFLRSLFAAPENRSWRQMGLAWAGLMWTRPDSFIHIGVLTGAMFLFLPVENGWRHRAVFLRQCLAAGLLCTAVYTPWLGWSWWYYGSPVPHTVVAKGLHLPVPSPGLLWHWLLDFPHLIADGSSTLSTTFLPHYAPQTGWPALTIAVSGALALVVSLVWLLPFVPRVARITSLSFLLIHFYLTFFPNYPFPWYVPPATLLAYLTIALVFSRLLELCGRLAPGGMPFRASRAALLVISGALLAASATVTIAAGIQLYWQQRLIEFDHRRAIGLFLHEQALSSRETVFLEPLGYIGFYSGLKMYDWPGLASPEVVAARRKLGSNINSIELWPRLIRELRPDWLVLRDGEVNFIREHDRELLQEVYRPYQEFDASQAVARHNRVWGFEYLTYDERFVLYRREAAFTPEALRQRGAILRPITVASLVRKSAAAEVVDVATPLPGTIFAHAPSVLTVRIPPGAVRLVGKFGLHDGAYQNPAQATDGAEFAITGIADAGSRRTLLTRALTPAGTPRDRGPQPFSIPLPAGSAGDLEFVVTTGPNHNGAFDWSYWSELNFVMASSP